MFKEKLDIEKYFEKLDNRNIITLCRFRTTNHKLPIETGRTIEIYLVGKHLEIGQIH